MLQQPQRGTQNAWLNRFVLWLVVCGFLCGTIAHASVARNTRIEDYEGRQITGVELVFEGTANDPAVQADFISLLKVAPNTQFSAVHVRESLQALEVFDGAKAARCAEFA